MQVAVAVEERVQVLIGTGLALSVQAWKPGQEPPGRGGRRRGRLSRLRSIHTVEICHAPHVQTHAFGFLIVPLAVCFVGERGCELLLRANIVAFGFQFAI